MMVWGGGGGGGGGGGCFFFQAEDGIRDLVRSRGSEMCIRDRVGVDVVIKAVRKTGGNQAFLQPGALGHPQAAVVLSLIPI